MLQQSSHYRHSTGAHETRSTGNEMVGKRAGNKRGRDSLTLYLSAPHHCANPACGRPILPHTKERLTDTRKRRFCSRSCAASVNNQATVAPKRKAAVVPCATCGHSLSAADRAAHRATCDACRGRELWRLGSTPLVDVTPSDIKRHARHVLESRARGCVICDYDVFVSFA